MAAEKQPAAQGENASASTEPTKSSRKKPLLIVAALMLVEGVAIFFGTRMLTGSAPASADAAHASPDAPGAVESGGHGGGQGGEGAKNAPFESEFGEIAISECRPTNRVSGRLVTFRMRVSVLVKAAELEKAKGLIESNKARIDDRINFVIRSADPAFLNEPTLETIKRRLKAELDRLMGDEHLIEEILIPEMLASAPGL
jgi:flagellar basal body-associated protein FliL